MWLTLFLNLLSPSNFFLHTFDITSHHEDVSNGVQNDKDCFGIFGGKQIQEWLQDVGLNKTNHLLNGAPTGKIGNSPHSLFLGFVITLQNKKKKKKKKMNYREQKSDGLKEKKKSTIKYIL